MIVPINNPAGRLYHIIIEAKHTSQKPTIRKVWEEILCSKYGYSNIFQGISDLKTALHEARSIVETQLNSQANHYSTTFDALEQLLNITNLDIRWDNTTSFLNDSAITELRFCALALSNIYHESPANDADLSSISTEINLLIEKIHASELNTDLKTIIIDLLYGSLHAITRYRILGVKALKNELHLTVGNVFFNKNIINENKENDIVKGFFAVIEKINTVTSAAANTLSILPGLTGILKSLT